MLPGCLCFPKDDIVAADRIANPRLGFVNWGGVFGLLTGACNKFYRPRSFHLVGDIYHYARPQLLDRLEFRFNPLVFGGFFCQYVIVYVFEPRPGLSAVLGQIAFPLLAPGIQQQYSKLDPGLGGWLGNLILVPNLGVNHPR